MIEAIEKLMMHLRRVKFYFAALSIALPVLAAILLKVAEITMLSLGSVGNSITTLAKFDDLKALLVIKVFGMATSALFTRGEHKFEWSHAVGYFALGCGSVILFLYFLPLFAFFVARDLVLPILNGIAAYLAGDATITLKLILKTVFYVYLIFFAIELLIQKYYRKQDVLDAVAILIRKHARELLEVLQELLEFGSKLVQGIWKIFFGTRRSDTDAE